MTQWSDRSEHDRLSEMCATAAAWAKYVLDARGRHVEVCGLLYECGPISIDNVSDRPETEYKMHDEQQFIVMTDAGWPEAVYHTHPGGRREPSSIDLSTALPNVPMLIGWPGGGGVWIDGDQTMEVIVGTATSDTVELYKDSGGQWRWRRKASNGATISGSEESFESKTSAARAAARANPDVFDTDGAGDTSTPGEGSGASGAIGGTATGGDTGYSGGGAGPTAPGTGTGGNSSGVGPTTGGAGVNSSGVGPTNT